VNILILLYEADTFKFLSKIVVGEAEEI